MKEKYKNNFKLNLKNCKFILLECYLSSVPHYALLRIIACHYALSRVVTHYRALLRIITLHCALSRIITHYCALLRIIAHYYAIIMREVYGAIREWIPCLCQTLVFRANKVLAERSKSFNCFRVVSNPNLILDLAIVPLTDYLGH